MRFATSLAEGRCAGADRFPAGPHALDWAASGWFLAALFGLSCLQIWMFPFFPSQDGPSHSYNAAILARYAEVPVWREYFRIEGVGFGGSLASHLPLRLLLQVLPAPAAEKVLVTVLLGCFFLALRSLLAAAGPQAGLFSPFIAMAAHNYFLFIGFWSFYASLAAALWTAGLLLRHLDEPEPQPARLGLVALASAMTYACHMAGWVILAVAAVVIGLSRLPGALTRCPDPRRALLGIAASVFLCLLPAAALVMQLDWSAPRVGGWGNLTLKERLWGLYSLAPLVALHWDEQPAVKLLAAGLLGAFCTTAVQCWRRRRFLAEPGLLLASAACALLSLLLPNTFGGGSFIRERFIFAAIVFGVAALSAAAGWWPRAARAAVFALLAGACALSWALRLPKIAEYNRLLEDCGRIISRIPANAVVLPIGPPSTELRIDPFVHLISRGCIRGAVDLSNYEASHLGFPVRFQPRRAPIPSLWTAAGQLARPPQFDIARYERATGGRVDFVLLRASWITRRFSIPPGLEQFRPEAGGPPSMLLLLKRDRTLEAFPAPSAERPAPGQAGAR